MPANKNALIRYKTIDNCLRNRYRRWTIDDLMDACCDALYDMEGIIYDNKYYRYSDPNYSIMNMPMSQNDYI
jgi:hypothetical protein